MAARIAACSSASVAIVRAGVSNASGPRWNRTSAAWKAAMSIPGLRITSRAVRASTRTLATAAPSSSRRSSARSGSDTRPSRNAFSRASEALADFAHGYLTKQLMSQRLKTLGPYGVVRLGGYSMDLVWPAFGAYANAPAPAEAIGGTVDQSDMDALKPLLDDSGWKVTLGIPLKKLLAPEQIKSSLRDPSPAVTLDNVTTLIGGQYYVKLKEISAAINAAVPGVHLKMTGPSANTAPTNIKLDEFVTAMEAGLDGELLVVAVELGVARVRRRVQRESGGRPARLARTARHRAARHAEPRRRASWPARPGRGGGVRRDPIAPGGRTGVPGVPGTCVASLICDSLVVELVCSSVVRLVVLTCRAGGW